MPAFQKRLLFVSFWKFCFLMFWVMLGSKLKMMMKMMMNCFCGMVGRRKTFRFISSRDMSEILTITNLRHATSRVRICAESEFRLSWMKLCSSDNYYTTEPNVNTRSIQYTLSRLFYLDFSGNFPVPRRRNCFTMKNLLVLLWKRETSYEKMQQIYFEKTQH